MSARHAVGLACLLALGCAKKSAPAPDAGSPAERVTDVRSAVFTIYPEFRFTRLEQAEARLVRRSRGAGHTDGGLAPAPFRIEETRQGDVLEQTLRLPLTMEDVTALLHASSSLTTQHFAAMLPRPAGSELLDETFVVEVEYTASPERADFLVWQLVNLLTGTEWKVVSLPEGWQLGRRADGGAGEVPHRFELELARQRAGTRIVLRRDGERVRVEYRQPT